MKSKERKEGKNLSSHFHYVLFFFFLPRGSRVSCKIMSSSSSHHPPSVDQVCVPANYLILMNLLLRKMPSGLSLKEAVPLKGHCRLRRRPANTNECMEMKKSLCSVFLCHKNKLSRQTKTTASMHPSIYQSSLIL